MTHANSKIWFLQLARAIACLSVVYTHWYGILVSPNVLHALILQDPLQNYPTVNLIDYAGVAAGYLGLKHFSTNYFGLGLFFILSGFVIPLSLKNISPGDYLIRRLLRIYPAVFCCLTIAAIVMMTASCYFKSSEYINFFAPKIYLTNIFLVKDLFEVNMIEYAAWTLYIEIHFYFLFFVLYYYGIHKKVTTFLVLIAFFAIIGFSSPYLMTKSAMTQKICYFITLNNGFISFMLVGTCLYYMTSKVFNLMTGCVLILLLLGVSYLSLMMRFNTEYLWMMLNHLYVFVFFIVLYSINNKLPFSKLLNKIADISYPLYLLHGFTGYTFYFVLYRLTENVPFSAIFSLSLVFSLATLLHYIVEKPCIKISKNLIDWRNNRIENKVLPASPSHL